MNLREIQWNFRVKRVLNLKDFLPPFLPGFLADFGPSLAELTEDPTLSTDTLVASFLSIEEAGCAMLSGDVRGEGRICSLIVTNTGLGACLGGAALAYRRDITCLVGDEEGSAKTARSRNGMLGTVPQYVLESSFGEGFKHGPQRATISLRIL
jgi:hypothetical protein